MPRPDTGTKQKLIDTAIDLIWTSSYGAVSVDDICRAAGVKKGSFYHYFTSKEMLAITAMEEYYAENMEPFLTQIFAANIPFDQQISQLADCIIEDQTQTLQKYGRVCGCPLAALACEMITDDGQPIAEKAEEIFSQCRSYLTAAIATAVNDGVIPPCDPETKSLEVHDFITGLMMMARIHNNIDSLEHTLKPGLIRILNLKTTNQSLKA
jgi:TetR/AcrR family transcriptional repressor of nem operon